MIEHGIKYKIEHRTQYTLGYGKEFRIECRKEFVVRLASRPLQFLGSTSSVPDGLGNQYDTNLVRDRGISF